MSRRLTSYSPKLIFSREPPVNVRGVSESHEIVKQTDSNLRVDAQESLGSPLSSEALLSSSLPHDLVMGGVSHGGSQQQIDGETMETVTDYFGGLQNHCRW